jgi:hypothetical protein
MLSDMQLARRPAALLMSGATFRGFATRRLMLVVGCW